MERSHDKAAKGFKLTKTTVGVAKVRGWLPGASRMNGMLAIIIRYRGKAGVMGGVD